VPRSVRLRVLDARGGASRTGRPDEPREKCAVFGVWGAPDSVALTYYGLFAQQHRGQESAGIAASDGTGIRGRAGAGLVPEVFSARTLRDLTESAAGPEGRPLGAIGHTRYSTYGAKDANFQPIIQQYSGGHVAVSHNGNLVNAGVIRDLYEQAGHIFHTTSDSEVVLHLLASPEAQRTTDPLATALRRLEGAFSFVMLFPDRIEAARDPWGWRPLCLGETDDGFPVVASETVALDAIGAKRLRSVEPGEIVTLSDQGVSSRRFAEPAPRRAHCVFEHVYFANPASRVFGQTVQVVRERLGEKLAEEAPVDADWVMPMPDSGRSAANGYARASGIPYREGIVPNRYVGRTFIKPSQEERQRAVSLKLSVVDEIVAGKRLIVVDDSIVRGTTTRTKMQQLYKGGAKEVHLRISCPPIRHPCYFGVDFARREELVAHERTVEEMRRFLGVDSLHFLTLDGLLDAAQSESAPREHYCTACYSGDYRIDIENPTASGVLTDRQMSIFAQE